MPVLQSFAEENAGKCTISFAVFGQVAAADLDLELGKGGRFCFACPAGFFPCVFFSVFTQNNEGRGADSPNPFPRSRTGLIS